MRPAIRRLVDRVVTLREGEGGTVLLMFAYSFLAMTAYNVIRPATRSKVISSLGADNLPYLLLGAGLIIGLLMRGYVRLADVLPRRWLIPLTQLGEAVLLVVFWMLFMTGAAWVSVAFYVLGLMLGVLLISQFWVVAQDLYDPRQARRLFGFIGGGASLGGLTGSGFTSLAADTIGTNNLLLVAASLLVVCAVIVARIVVRHERITGVPTDERGVGRREAAELLRSRHLQIIALVISAAAVGSVIIDQQLNMVAESLEGAGETDTITTFLAGVTFYVSLAGFIIQIGLTSRIHRTFGLGVALLLLPVSLGSSATLILATGAVWATALARVLDASLRYTIDKTTREVLFLPLPADLRRRAKPFVDVTVDRLAKACGALLLLVLIKPWGLGLDWRQLSWASLALMAGWLVLGVVARREYLRSFRRSLGDRSIAASNVRLDVADGATVEALVEELASPDEDAVLYAIDLLEALDKRNLITPLLLHHQSPRVRARALAALGAARPDVRGRWAPHVTAMVSDADPNVRAAAVEALAALGAATTVATMRPFLDDEDPRVAATAAAALASSDQPNDQAQANAVFTRLTTDPRPAAAAARREAAAALAKVRDTGVRRLLAVLARDGDVTVVREAVVAMRAGDSRDPSFVPVLVALLGHRDVKRDARQTLLAYGPDLVPLLDYILRDVDEPSWVRRHVPGTLAGVGTQAAMDALVPALADQDGFVRFKALEAVEHLHRQHPALHFDRSVIEQRLGVETTGYYASLVLRHDLTRKAATADDPLIIRALDDRLERTTDRLYRLLALLYPWRDVTAARLSLERGDARIRARAVEYIDGLLTVSLRRRLLPILDVTAKDECVRRAYAVLRTRPRDTEDALAQLIHDDAPVIAAAAILHAVDRRHVALGPDIEYVATHRPASGDHARQVAAWAITRNTDTLRAIGASGDLPVIVIAERLRQIPLFGFVSVDELCRIAARGKQCVYTRGQAVIRQEAPADRACFLLEGTVTIGENPSLERTAPAALDLDAVLEGTVVPQSIRAASDVLTFEITSHELLAMLADSEPLAQGIFRMLLAGGDARWARLGESPEAARLPDRELRTAVDTVLLLRQLPLFRETCVDDVLSLAAIVRDQTMVAGAAVSDETGAPSFWHVVSGQLRVEREADGTTLLGPGQAVGIVDVLTGIPSGWRVTAVAETRLLRISSRDLFEWLTDHVRLLQGLLSVVLATARADSPNGAARAGDSDEAGSDGTSRV